MTSVALALSPIGMLGGLSVAGWPSARATVTLNVTLLPAEQLSLEAYPDKFDGDGAYFVEAHELSTGGKWATHNDTVLAVIDGRRRHLQHEPAVALQAAGGLEIESIQDLVAVRLPGGTLAMVAP